jgi:hypothetical protein
MTMLRAYRDTVDYLLKGAGTLLIDPNRKGYSQAAVLQPMRSVLANSSNHKANQLIQVKLHN